MLAPRVRVEGCARCAHGKTGKRTSLPKFIDTLEEDLVEDHFQSLHRDLKVPRERNTCRRSPVLDSCCPSPPLSKMSFGD